MSLPQTPKTTPAATIPTAIKAELLNAVQDHVKSVLDASLTVARHAKRARIHPITGDVHTRLHASDINVALHWLRVDPLYAVDIPNRKKKKIVRLQDIVEAKDDWMAPPLEVAMQQHWLAVDGVAVDGSNTSPTASSSTNVPVLSSTKENEVTPSPSSSAPPVQIDHLLVSGLLSEELKLFYTRVTTQLSDDADELLLAVATTRGVQELVPFLLRYWESSLNTALYEQDYQAAHLQYRLLHALLCNPHVQLELSLHRIFPCLLTAVVYDPQAAPVLAMAVRSYQTAYTTLPARTAAALARSLTAGTLRGLTLLGRVDPATTMLRIYKEFPEWDAPTQQAALTAAGQCCVIGNEEGEVWGDAAVALCRVPTEYAACFV